MSRKYCLFFCLFLAACAFPSAAGAQQPQQAVLAEPCQALGSISLSARQDDMLGCVFDEKISSGVWRSLTGAPSAVPVGTIAFFVSPVCPEGWVLAAGQTTAQYSKLFNTIGPFMPDLRGEFIRGWDAGKGVDKGRHIGSSQKQATEQLYALIRNKGRGSFDLAQIKTPDWTANFLMTGDSSLPRSFGENEGVAIEPLGKGETRPRNVALLPCIATGE